MYYNSVCYFKHVMFYYIKHNILQSITKKNGM